MNSGGGLPEDRKADLLILAGLRFFGHHGVSQEERDQGGEFTVDLEVEADIARALVSDDVSDTVNYVDLYQLVRHVVEEGQFHLLEAMASRIAEAVLGLPRVERVKVSITKPPRLPAQTTGFAVEIVRSH
ncbi:MAG: dihydroneopterin aldolase [Candidatus Dormiibacterota bacterium]